VQRRLLRRDQPVHPLVERIIRIHVTEEARHLSFARHYLKRNVPELSRSRRAALAVGAPLILAVMARLMLRPSTQVVARHDIPRDVIARAYGHNEQHRARTAESLQKVRSLCAELGLLGRSYRLFWRALGLV
jgi:hypothetical protein